MTQDVQSKPAKGMIYNLSVIGDRTSPTSTLPPCALRHFHDGVNIDWFAFPPEVLVRISTRITNVMRGVNRILYDMMSKPPERLSGSERPLSVRTTALLTASGSTESNYHVMMFSFCS